MNCQIVQKILLLLLFIYLCHNKTFSSNKWFLKEVFIHYNNRKSGLIIKKGKKCLCYYILVFYQLHINKNTIYVGSKATAFFFSFFLFPVGILSAVPVR